MLRELSLIVLSFSLVLPLSASAAIPPITITPSSGPMGAPVVVAGDRLGGQWANKTIEILFGDSTVGSTTTDASGNFSTSFFVPVVKTGNYTVAIESGGNVYGSSQIFKVTFGTDTLSLMNTTLSRINATVASLGQMLQGSTTTMASLQSQLSALKNNLTQIQSLIRSVSSEVSSAQAPTFSSLTSEMNGINQTITNIGTRLAELNASQAANKQDLDQQWELSLVSIGATLGVGIALLVYFEFRVRRKVSAGIRDWDIYD